MFNDISIERFGPDGVTVTQNLKIPLTYSAKDKMLARVLQDPDISKATAINLPVISFEMGNMKYNGDNKLTTTRKSVVKNNANTFSYVYNPVAYDINFKVYVYTKSEEDGNKIIEQILPFFTPDWTTSVELIPEIGTQGNRDIPVILNSVSKEENFDDKMTISRAIIWTLDLTLKGFLFGPVKNGPVIKFVTTNFYIPDVPDHELVTAVGNTAISVQLTMQPGLTANGLPTSDITQSVPANTITVDSDYGYIETIIDEI